MERSTAAGTLRIGDWCVNPASGQIARDGEPTRLDARTMRLLICLAEHPGEVVSIDDLLNYAWAGVTVTPDSVYQGVATLRRLLGDDSKQPAYIATVPRLGYRMVAAVSPWTEEEHPAPVPSSRFNWRVGAVVAVAIAVLALVVAASRFYGGGRTSSATAATERSIAVLPFLDLTERMTQEPFADGMTEELIGRLSKIPGLRVPAPTASFYFKGKKVTTADIGRSLGVKYLLDGSVRKAGSRLRVAARLVVADTGYVVWSDNYDRPLDDILIVQDYIAGEVTKILKSEFEVRPPQ
ncbi:MAG TPA: winged helix-turn-helix domain-containing protein [Bryobacteraceae bacterium]|jgi:TolB-like protein/DNA-binding winged helix-turn-helix (wHTH) protein